MLALAALLAGCATPPPRSGGAAGMPAAGAPVAPAPGTAPALPGQPARPEAPAPVSPLAAEKRWLDEWFNGTPVVIALQGESALNVEVPLVNSFDRGSHSIKPALAAVLDRVATSLRRQASMRVSIAAPSDAGAAAAQASTRAQQVRNHLVARGVPAARIGSLGIARAGAPVQLSIVVAVQPIARLDDSTLPVPAQAVRPVATTAAPGPQR